MHISEALDATAQMASLRSPSALPVWGWGPSPPLSPAQNSFSDDSIKGQVVGQYDGVLERTRRLETDLNLGPCPILLTLESHLPEP